LIRWFADLPIERKLRVVIMVPAMAAFGIAMLMHFVTNVLYPDWPGYLLITVAAVARAAATADFRTYRESRAHHAAGLRRGGLHAARGAQFAG
jgi:hypothetical protein